MTRVILAIVFAQLALTCHKSPAQTVPTQTLDRLLQAAVKVYGVGGLAGLEAYQSGFLISDQGHIVTADSLVLEQGEVTISLYNGERYSGHVLGADPLLRVAVVKIDLAGDLLPGLDMDQTVQPRPGQPLLIVSNLFNIAQGNEPASVMRTHLAATAPREVALGAAVAGGSDAVLLVDSVTSNPGAAGGLLADYHGRPVGMIGVERRGRVTGAWLNYALPISQVSASVRQIIEGQQLLGNHREDPLVEVDTHKAWGFVLVESILPRTPPYIEYVRPDSAAAAAGMRPDDLLVMVDGLVSGAAEEAARLLSLRAQGELSITLERNGELIEATLPGLQEGGQE